MAEIGVNGRGFRQPSQLRAAKLQATVVMYPRFKLLYAAGVTAIAVAVVAGDSHFLSDVVAGGFPRNHRCCVD